jgi:hypothetical protein
MSSQKDVHVTEALGILDRGFGYVPPRILKERAAEGVEIHRYSLSGIKGFYAPAPPEVEPYVQKVLGWVDRHVAEVLDVEVKIRIPDLGVVGRCDLVAKIKGDRAWSVIDLKFVNAVPRWVGLQLAAYRRGLETVHRNRSIRRQFALRVPKLESPCVADEFTYEENLLGFMYSVFLYRHLKAA